MLRTWAAAGILLLALALAGAALAVGSEVARLRGVTNRADARATHAEINACNIFTIAHLTQPADCKETP